MAFSREEYWRIPFSRRSSQPRDRTCVSCIAGRFFTIWATREALSEPQDPNLTNTALNPKTPQKGWKELFFSLHRSISWFLLPWEQGFFWIIWESWWMQILWNADSDCSSGVGPESLHFYKLPGDAAGPWPHTLCQSCLSTSLQGKHTVHILQMRNGRWRKGPTIPEQVSSRGGIWN